MISPSEPVSSGKTVSIAHLSLVVCAAPLAERASDVAAAIVAAGFEVSVVATPAAATWVDEAAVRRATGRGLAVNHRRPDEPKRGPRPSAVVACPLTFNTLNKLAAGISDTYALGVLNEALAAGTPIVAVPVVSDRLWPHPALRPNLDRLAAAGVTFLDPQTGQQGAKPVRSGTGQQVAGAFDPAWLVPRIGGTSAA
jgi:phosphopantothenoylcysteine synthetase/decarboxylase